MKLGTFLDCGCFIGPEGRRTLCPSCASFTPVVPVGYVTERECRERERRARIEAFREGAAWHAEVTARWEVDGTKHATAIEEALRRYPEVTP